MQELKDKIISTAHIYFLNGGIKWLNLHWIANDCGITRKTLNQYFNRNELIDAVIENLLKHYYKSLESIKKERLGPGEELGKILNFTENSSHDFSAIFLRDIQRHYPENWSLIYGFIKGTLKELFIRNLTEGIKQGLYRKTIDPVLLTELYLNTVLMLIEKRLEEFNARSVGRIISEMNTIFLAGLTNIYSI